MLQIRDKLSKVSLEIPDLFVKMLEFCRWKNPRSARIAQLGTVRNVLAGIKHK